MEQYEEFYDQTAMIGFIMQTHLKKHEGKIDPTCEFCRKFLMQEPIDDNYPLESYKFIILDIIENGK